MHDGTSYHIGQIATGKSQLFVGVKQGCSAAPISVLGRGLGVGLVSPT